MYHLQPSGKFVIGGPQVRERRGGSVCDGMGVFEGERGVCV